MRSSRTTLCAGLLGFTLVACTGSVEPGGPDPHVYPEPDPMVGNGSLGLRTLVGWHYRNAIRDLLGPEAATAVSPPEDVALNGFEAIGTGQLTVTVDRATAYQTSAYAAADAMLAARRDEIVGCAGASPTDEACFTSFVTEWGARAWRRPLAADEIAAWVALATEAGTATGDFDEGIRFVIAGFLQAPSFLYQVGVGVPDGARARIEGYEMATRLSFFLTGTTPDDDLLAAAAAGELDDEGGVRAHALRLLETPGAREAVERFFDEILGWRGLADMRRDATLFPEFDAELASAMREESRAFVEEVAWNGDFRDFFTADFTFVDSRLAELYGLPDPGAGFARATLDPTSRRGGILGQASFLAVSSRAARTSPTTRGRLVRLRFLCESVPPPPPGVVTDLPEPMPGAPAQTTRERLLQHRIDPTCASCHTKMDDLGLGLEIFDAIGAYRETENDLPIDATSTFDDRGTFNGARELGQLLADDPRTSACLVQNLFRVATGRIEVAGEEPALSGVRDRFVEDHSFENLLLALVASDAFRYAALPEGVMP